MKRSVLYVFSFATLLSRDSIQMYDPDCGNKARRAVRIYAYCRMRRTTPLPSSRDVQLYSYLVLRTIKVDESAASFLYLARTYSEGPKP